VERGKQGVNSFYTSGIALKDMTINLRFLYILLSLLVVVNPSANAISDNSWDDISDIGACDLIGTALNCLRYVKTGRGFVRRLTASAQPRL
jgi:hypothetical protein